MHPVFYISITDLVGALDAFTALYPEIREELHRTVQHPHFQKIFAHNFKNLKERICIAQHFLRNYPDVREDFINIILYEDMKHVKETLNMISHGTDSTGILNTLWSTVSYFASPSLHTHTTYKSLKFKEADADSISDTQFLVQLGDLKTFPIMTKIVEETEAAALEYFRLLLPKKIESLVRSVQHIQVNECVHQVRREAASREEVQLAELRRMFIKEINYLTQGHHS